MSVERKIDRIALRTEAIRGLKLTGETERRLISADEMRELLAMDFAEDAEEIALAQRLYALLRIIPPDMDLEAALTDAFGDIAVGMFDHDSDAMYAVAKDGELSPQSELTLAHEFTHALQYANFDVARLRDEMEGNSDRSAAFTALREGDATLTDELYYLNAFDSSQQDAADLASAETDMSAFFAAPVFLRRVIAFPYIEGRRFAVLMFLQTDDFSLLDAAYSDLPASTEQIIHPEKYGADYPVEVSVSISLDALGDGWSVLERDAMGELFFRSMLEGEPATAQTAGEAAAGWGGDSYALLQTPDGATAMASASAWDSVEDTVDMAIALRSYFMLSTGASGWRDESASADGEEIYRLASDGVRSAEIRVDSSAKRILLIVAESDGAVDALAGAMFED